MKRPALVRLASACALAAAIVVLRDAAALASTASWVLFSLLSLFLLGFAALGEALARVPLPRLSPSTLRRLAIAAAVLPPVGYGWVAWWGSREALPWWSPLAFAAVAAVAAIGLVRLPPPAGRDGRRWAVALSIAALIVVAAMLAVMRVTAALVAVRPGTGLLHVALYVGIAGISMLLVPLLATRFSRSHGAVSTRYRVVAAGAVAWGLGLLEADRLAFVGLYPYVHLWLGAMGLLTLETGFRMWLESRRHVGWWQAGAVSCAIIAVAGVWMVLAPPHWSDLSVRLHLRTTALGSSLLRVLPAPHAALPWRSTAKHPLLAYEQHLAAPPLTPRPNVALVTIDALRHDAVLPVGAENPHMPHLQRFAERAVRFRRAYAQGPRTAIAMSALLLGRYSANIDWNLWVYRRGQIFDPQRVSPAELAALVGKYIHTTIPTVPDATLLAERLQRAGYYTVAVPYAGNNLFFRKGVGFERGFDRFVDLTGTRWAVPTSARVTAVALRELDKLDPEPWFLWVHYYDPHEERRNRGRYDELCRAVDSALGPLLEAVRERSTADRTVIIVAADHGQALGEHGNYSHASSLYDEQVRVPLLIQLPAVEGRDEDRPVAAIDIAATLAAMAGADTDRLDGVNLVPLLRDGTYPADRPVFTELHRYRSNRTERTTDLKAVVLGRHKLIVDRLQVTAELFDVRGDPGELDDLVTRDDRSFRRLADVLASFLHAAERDHPLP